MQITPARIIVGYYIIVVTIATILLSLPISRVKDAEWSFIDAVFTSVSAVSVTGLSTIEVSKTFTPFGTLIFMLILQIGGVGIMTIGTFFWLLFRKKISFKERRLIMADQNQVSFSGLVQLLKQLLIVLTAIELFGALILGTYYLHFYPTWQEAYYNGLFSSISATTNGGFNLTGSSLIPYKNDYFVQFIHMILIILGAIGFPVLIELKNYFFREKDSYERVTFSLFTKITTLTYFLLAAIGAFLFYIFEFGGFLKGKTWHESLFYGLFHSISTRSGGFVTMDLSLLSESTQLLFSGLMFIGASPSSVGGGIRTTTFALTILFLIQFARGNRTIKIFKREIFDEDYLKALVVSIFGVILCFTAILIISYTDDFPINAIVFEVCSAFGTSGMSLGITPELSVIGKIIIMILMFIGRVGILMFIFMIGGKEKKENYHYPKERIIIG